MVMLYEIQSKCSNYHRLIWFCPKIGQPETFFINFRCFCSKLKLSIKISKLSTSKWYSAKHSYGSYQRNLQAWPKIKKKNDWETKLTDQIEIFPKKSSIFKSEKDPKIRMRGHSSSIFFFFYFIRIVTQILFELLSF
jgi:hypothetical protein